MLTVNTQGHNLTVNTASHSIGISGPKVTIQKNGKATTFSGDFTRAAEFLQAELERLAGDRSDFAAVLPYWLKRIENSNNNNDDDDGNADAIPDEFVQTAKFRKLKPEEGALKRLEIIRHLIEETSNTGLGFVIGGAGDAKTFTIEVWNGTAKPNRLDRRHFVAEFELDTKTYAEFSAAALRLSHRPSFMHHAYNDGALGHRQYIQHQALPLNYRTKTTTGTQHVPMTSHLGAPGAWSVATPQTTSSSMNMAAVGRRSDQGLADLMTKLGPNTASKSTTSSMTFEETGYDVGDDDHISIHIDEDINDVKPAKAKSVSASSAGTATCDLTPDQAEFVDAAQAYAQYLVDVHDGIMDAIKNHEGGNKDA